MLYWFVLWWPDGPIRHCLKHFFFSSLFLKLVKLFEETNSKFRGKWLINSKNQHEKKLKYFFHIWKERRKNGRKELKIWTRFIFELQAIVYSFFLLNLSDRHHHHDFLLILNFYIGFIVRNCVSFLLLCFRHFRQFTRP